MLFTGKMFVSEKPKEELTKEDPIIIPEPEETKEAEPELGSVRIIEKWERNKNGAPVKKYVVQTYRLNLALIIGISYYWGEVKRFGTLKVAQTHLTNMQKPLPEDKVVTL